MRTREASKNGPRVKRIAGVLGVPSRSDLGEGRVGIATLDTCDVRTPRGQNSPGSERTACQDGMVVKARNHARVASALPHSEGLAYKPPCGEVAICRRVGRMGPGKRRRTGTAEPGPERGPLGRRVTHPPWRCIFIVGGPAQYGTTAVTLPCTKGDGKPAVSRRMPGAGLSLWRSGKAPPDTVSGRWTRIED